MGMLFFFGSITALLAHRKGYNPLCWFFAGGAIGLIVLAFRPFVNKGDLNMWEQTELKKKGDRIGLIISGVGLALGILLGLLLS